MTADLDLPKTPAKVKKWLEANPNADPKLFAPFPKQKVKESAAAVTALAMIGTPEAFSVLTQYRAKVDSNGYPVGGGRFGDLYSDQTAWAMELAWERFDPASLVRELLLHLHTLPLGNMTFSTLAGFETLVNPFSVRIGVTGDCDLSPMAGMVKMKYLHLAAGPRSGGFEPLAGALSLTDMRICGNVEPSGYESLAGASILRLRCSPLGGDETPFTFTPFTALPKLKTLCVDFFNHSEQSPERARADAEAVSELVQRGCEVKLGISPRSKQTASLVSGEITQIHKEDGLSRFIGFTSAPYCEELVSHFNWIGE